MELFVEFKRESTSDPFNDLSKSRRKKSLLKHNDMASAIRGQITLYSTRMQMYQFRTCIYSVGIFGEVARLFRWDRAGAIVSEPIKYSVTGNRELSEFFYRFGLVDDTRRGWDPTVRDANAEETSAFAEAIKTIAEGRNAALLDSLLESVGTSNDYPRKKVTLKGRRSYIIGRSLVAPKSPTGRATRVFVAMNTNTKKLVCLKDSWRPDLDEMKPEDEWYGMLKGARNTAAFLHGSDILSPRKQRSGFLQSTITQNHSRGYCDIQGMMGYIHHRTVQSELYLPLKTFKDSKNLTEIMRDIILGTCLFCLSNVSPLTPLQRYRILTN